MFWNIPKVRRFTTTLLAADPPCSWAPENVNKPIQRGHRHIWHDAGVLIGPFSVRKACHLS